MIERVDGMLKLVPLAFMGLTTSVSAQDQDPILLDCVFSTSAAANISTTTGIQAEIDSDETMEFQFVLSPDKSATMVANNGASKVIPISGENRLSFIEVTGNGTVQTTAIYGIGLGKKAAVHSRTSGGEGFELPSQWYGYCETK